jgi:hypothetical protein
LRVFKWISLWRSPHDHFSLEARLQDLNVAFNLSGELLIGLVEGGQITQSNLVLALLDLLAASLFLTTSSLTFFVFDSADVSGQTFREFIELCQEVVDGVVVRSQTHFGTLSSAVPLGPVVALVADEAGECLVECEQFSLTLLVDLQVLGQQGLDALCLLFEFSLRDRLDGQFESIVGNEHEEEGHVAGDQQERFAPQSAAREVIANLEGLTVLVDHVELLEHDDGSASSVEIGLDDITALLVEGEGQVQTDL